jgi:glycosyltransferase involved in cell wall biosynthesis
MSDDVCSIVVIGFNEADRLRECLQSALAVRDAGHASEVIYVDGGSSDGSIEIAESCAVDDVLKSDVQRSAAANRNVGWRHARSDLIQFLDADMDLDPDWAALASKCLAVNQTCAAVCGEIQERQSTLWARVFELDWQRVPGAIAYCGGAALFRRSALETAGGFPEDVPYGEEPLLCWHIRNELGQTIEYVAAPMVTHDLAFRGFRDYWRRCKRVGETQALIAARCSRTSDPLWRGETIRGLVWPSFYVAAVAVLVFAPPAFSVVPVAAILFLLIRKSAQTFGKGQTAFVACAYAAHTYFAKIPIGLGIAGWKMRRPQSATDATR